MAEEQATKRADFALRSFQFRKEREDTWRELEEILALVRKRGLRRLSPAQMHKLPALYRATLSSLSVARAISLDRNVVDYLESLSTRAYFVVYGPKQTATAVFTGFFLEVFPQTFRKLKWHVAAATLLVILGSLTGYFLTASDPDNYYTMLPPELAQGRTPASSTESLKEVLFGGDEHTDEDLVEFSTMLFTHNSGVGILAFAVSIVPVLLVSLLCFYNGLIVGAMTQLYHSRELAVEWWSWILPHGVTEFLAIFICAGAGLSVGMAALFPGDLPRLTSMARRGREASMLVMGSILMFFIAGLIEGVFRQRVTDLYVRYGVVTVTAIIWFTYFTFMGRRRAVS